MSEMARAARAAMKAKATRLGKTDPHQKVDASSWTPPEPMNTGAKVGMRPISKRAFKRGGKVIEKCEGGPAKMRSDRKARKAGGRSLVTDLINRNDKKANKAREGGDAHVGGYKRGGDVAQDKKMIKKAIAQHDKHMHGGKHEDIKLKKGGRTKREGGGEVDYEGWKNLQTGKGPAQGQGDKTSGPGGSQMPRDKRAKGGKTVEKPTPKPDMSKPIQPVMDRFMEKFVDPYDTPRKARKDGGRTKGKTNIKIMINTQPPQGQQPQPMAPKMPTPAPMPPPPIAPPGMGGSLPPAPPPGLAGGPPPGMPPMPRKRGGRAYRSYKDMDAGAMSGVGRLEKTEIEHGKRVGRLSGGRARSYKDMDAGAMSGMGRIEKTAIQKHKR